jgi:hypothetical protein
VLFITKHFAQFISIKSVNHHTHESNYLKDNKKKKIIRAKKDLYKCAVHYGRRGLFLDHVKYCVLRMHIAITLA